MQHVTESGVDAVAQLTSGVSIDLQRVGNQWLVQDIGGSATHAGHVSSGPCAGS